MNLNWFQLVCEEKPEVIAGISVWVTMLFSKSWSNNRNRLLAYWEEEAPLKINSPASQWAHHLALPTRLLLAEPPRMTPPSQRLGTRISHCCRPSRGGKNETWREPAGSGGSWEGPRHWRSGVYFTILLWSASHDWYLHPNPRLKPGLLVRRVN